MLKNLVLLLFGIVLALLVAEIVARALFPEYADDDAFFERAFARLVVSRVTLPADGDNFSRRFGYTLSPNTEHTEVLDELSYTVRTNSLGFRSKEIEPKQDGEYRIMLVGDSMFWGVGVEEPDMISSVIERSGASASPRKVSVYNYSVVGYNTVQELLVAREHIDALQPDHVILGFFIGNDILPNAIAFIDDDGNYGTSPEIESDFRGELEERWAFSNSVILRMISFLTYVPRVRYQLAVRKDVIESSYSLLSEFGDLANSRGAMFSVVIIYPKESVRGGITAAWSNSREAGRMIETFCRRNSIETLDLIRYMNTPEHEGKFYWENDGHLNRDGNLAIGNAIFEDLVRTRLDH